MSHKNRDDEDLIDLIDTALSDSLDMDWTTGIGAKAVLRALRDEGILPPAPSVLESSRG